MIYTLMSKHIPLAELKISDTGKIISIDKIHNDEAFPVGIITSHTDYNLSAILSALNKWWHGRAIPASRDALDYVLAISGVETAAALSMQNLGLSLSDQYWLKPHGSDLSWDDVNFFTNEFSGDLGDSFFDSSKRPDISLYSPDASSNGWLKKRWKIINGERCLLKAGSGITLQEPYNEKIASEIMDVLDLPHVHYDLIVENGKPFSVCKDFIDSDTEYVPAVFITQVLLKGKNESALHHLLRCADYLNIPAVREYIDNLLTIDFLIENTDRHYGNFGFIRDINTLKFIGPAPIFDSGTSLWHQSPLTDIGDWQICYPFMQTQKQQIKLVQHFHINAAQLSRCESITRKILSQNSLLDERRLAKISLWAGNRARVLSLLAK